MLEYQHILFLISHHCFYKLNLIETRFLYFYHFPLIIIKCLQIFISDDIFNLKF